MSSYKQHLSEITCKYFEEKYFYIYIPHLKYGAKGRNLKSCFQRPFLH